MTDSKRTIYSQIREWPTRDFLILEGIAIPEIVNFMSIVFRWKPRPNQRVCVLARSQIDVLIGHQFDVLFPLPLETTTQAVHTPCILELVTQQFFTPVPQIDYGWGTICVFTFPEGVPPVVDALPLVEEFYQREICIGMANIREWEMIRDFMDK